MVKQGDTFLIDDHLLVVISDPAQDPDNLVLVAMTTREDYKDQSCVLYSGDHPFIGHDTLIAYNLPGTFMSSSQLGELLTRGDISRNDPVTPEVLEKILVGADESQDIPMQFWNALDDQGLFK